ncbi:ABC transporter ATP-binding protein [Catellatospora sp. KI3]|uniref:ABC transporter transmembrane domain-containing protein n=1 Tax=Catellatospora sp. KI3 TaxID=3041620 RepID=UPI002482D866|nr:ABC transporter ATP-binding protein [Catellatospora sp. KI3]MDI1461644.1 ABC transporter ATP-binding protein [Catellatospora sp. KI3]
MTTATVDTGGAVLRRTVARNRRRLTVGSALIGVHQVCESLVPILIGVIVDRAVATGDGYALARWIAALGLLFTVLTVAYRFGARQLMQAIADEAHLLRLDLAATVLRPRGLRTEQATGDLLSVATVDTDQTSYVLDYIPRLVGAVVAIGISAAALLAIDVPLGLTVLVGTPLVLLALQAATPALTRRAEAQQELAGEATAVATDLVSGLRPLAGIGATGAAADRYREVSGRSRLAMVRAARAQGAYTAASGVGSALLAGAAAVLAGWFALRGDISVGELITVIGLAQFLMEPMGLLAVIPGWVAQARGSANRIAAVLAAPAVLPEPAAPAEAAPEPELNLAGLSYSTLSDLDLEVRGGEFVAVVATRATDGDALAAVLSGRVPPDDYRGEARLGGSVLGQHRADGWPLHAEPHHPDLFTGTIGSNLTAGAAEGDEPDQELLAAALRASAADQVLRAAPGGLAHPVAERGASLSGGQRQRLALARALLARPPLLVLHHPTTAVDAVTEHAIARGLRALRHPERASGPAQTTVVITSSPALLAVADRVVLVEQGRAVATGTHTDLSRTEDAYRRAVLR